LVIPLTTNSHGNEDETTRQQPARKHFTRMAFFLALYIVQVRNIGLKIYLLAYIPRTGLDIFPYT
jgi:hypothetical protein